MAWGVVYRPGGLGVKPRAIAHWFSFPEEERAILEGLLSQRALLAHETRTFHPLLVFGDVLVGIGAFPSGTRAIDSVLEKLGGATRVFRRAAARLHLSHVRYGVAMVGRGVHGTSCEDNGVYPL